MRETLNSIPRSAKKKKIIKEKQERKRGRERGRERKSDNLVLGEHVHNY
jgi:hypothetical protein